MQTVRVHRKGFLKALGTLFVGTFVLRKINANESASETINPDYRSDLKKLATMVKKDQRVVVRADNLST